MSEEFKEKIRTFVELIGLKDASVEFDEEGGRISIIADEGEWLKSKTPELVLELRHIVSLIARKSGENERYFVDINNYRKERERLIVEIGKAAAKKAILNNSEVALPAMNSYERRLVHTELSMRPDVKTESSGDGKGRYIVVKPI